MKKEILEDRDCIWPIRMKQSLKKEFKSFCDTNGYSMNKKIKIMIEKEIKNNGK